MKEPIPVKEQEMAPVPLSANYPGSAIYAGSSTYVDPTTYADATPFMKEEEKPAAPLVAIIQPQPANRSDDKSPRIEWVLSTEPEPVPQPKIQAANASKSSPASAASGGYLARPSNIYAEEPWNDKQSNPEHNSAPTKEPTLNTSVANPSKEEETSPDMQLVFRDAEPTADEPGAHQTHSISVPNSPAEEPAAQDDTDDLKRRAAERINKLRNLSFNVNAADPNNEFETVPAYIRRNLELYNTISNVENFYSNYEVKTDENNNTEISTINTFLDGKRPD
jgi:cell division protein FtsZ